MKFFIYARKSTEDEARQVLSIDAQLDELRMLASKERLDVAHEYLEELRNWHKKSGSNLLLAAAILSGGGGSGSADGQETETDGSRSAGQSPSLTATLRGGSAARSRISPDIGKRVESPRIEENKAISCPSADGVTVTASASGDVAKFIPILPADVASLS